MTALPEPKEGGSAEQLRSFLNLPADGDGEQNWRLILAWLAQAFMPSGPYPVLVLLGPQGSAKTTAGRILRKLVDPSTVLDRGVPRDEHNLFIEGVSNWVVSIDNLSSLPAWLSDALCRLSTGGGFSTRTLYENRDQELFEASRPVILTGISDVATRPDLLDRSLIVNLPAIPKERRRREKEVYADLAKVAPAVLGFVFSAIAEGLGRVEGVHLDELPRMADFATWGIATEEPLGGEAGSFMRAYAGSQEEATETVLESWPVASHLREFAMGFVGLQNTWVGTAQELLDALNDRVEDDALKRSKAWPKAPNKLTEQINRLAPSLKEKGVFVERPTGSHKKGRLLAVYYINPDDGGDDGDGGGRSGDDTTKGTVPPENPIDEPSNNGGDDGDDLFSPPQKEKYCKHGASIGARCVFCEEESAVQKFLANPPEWFINQAEHALRHYPNLPDEIINNLTSEVACQVFGSAQRGQRCRPLVREKLEELRP